ncbi:MAG TPA: FAD-binding oxidoreductase [Patescibacteria group bacterium]|nr:FAD-binding oxidoreductase [Patescibacteria group bacterium]
MPEQQFFSVKLISKTMISRDIMELHFEKPVGFSFIPGQFVQFQVPQPEGVLLRSYSVSSHPAEVDLEFCAKMLPEGKASALFSRLEAGESVQITAAKGVFGCRADHSPKKVFIATGAGIAPIMSMMKEQLEIATMPAVVLVTADARGTSTVQPQSFQSVSTNTNTLLFGIRTPEDSFWKERLEQLAGEYPQFSFHVTSSRPAEPWNGLRGRVTAHLPQYIIADAEYYICGSVEMVKDVRTLLMNNGVNTKNIHFEIF